MVRMSHQMENILLAMLKAERDPASTIGQVMVKNAEMYGKTGLGTMDLMPFIKGALALNAKGKYRQSVRRRTLKKSPGKHGHLFGLTSKGRVKAEEVWAEVSMFVEKRSHLL
jgi:hypothetical protein